MKNYQAFVNLKGYIDVKARSIEEARGIIEDGWIVVQAVKNGFLEIEVEDIYECEEEV